LRIRRPEASRPFRTPLLFVVAPLGIVVNLLMMLFLPIDTWLRLVGWLVLGLIIFVGYGFRHSALGQRRWLLATGLGVEGESAAYFRSATYQRRLRFSLWFCLIAAGAALGLTGWLAWRWHERTLGDVFAESNAVIRLLFADINPIILLIVGGGLSAF